MKKLDKKAVFFVVTLVSIILAFAWSEAIIAVIGVVLVGLALLVLKDEKKPEEEFIDWPFPTSKPTTPPATIELASLIETPVSAPEPVIEAPIVVQTPKKRGRKPKKPA